jgi:peptide/nickel transport system substrate-binding protein
MMRFRSKAIGGIAVAVASITALAACSSSSSHSSSGTSASGAVTPPGAIGSVPAQATGTEHAGTITWAEQPGATPNWILPVVPSSSNTVFNNFSFIWMMWRPLIWTVDGVQPIVDPSMSIANTPVYSNGDDLAEEQLQVVERPAHHGQRPGFLHRPGQGRHQGVPGQLGGLRPRPLPG